jgi:hypothetical protein
LEEEEPNVIATRSGCTIKPTQRLIEEAGYVGRDELDSDYNIELIQAKIKDDEAKRNFPKENMHPERWHVWEQALVVDSPIPWNYML